MNVNQLDRLCGIISQKYWSHFDLISHPELTTQEALTDMLSRISSNEIDMALDLLEDYHIIKDYTRPSRQLMELIYNSHDENEFVITPLTDYGSDRTKSGHSLHYEMSNFSSIFKSKIVKFFDDPKNPACQKKDVLHVCVDDYIGTGNQFFKMCENIKEDGKENNIKVIATICIQKQAKERLEDAGYAVRAIEVKEKGLENLAKRRMVSVDEVYLEYDKLEKRIDCPPIYNRGRDACEALVTMKATPNNTLPIFWFQGKNKWPAPFPRPRR